MVVANTMSIELDEHQRTAISKLNNGKILVGGVGSGKSRTALAYFFTKVCGGQLGADAPAPIAKSLYIITTARKRDTHEWEEEHAPFQFAAETVIVDSWNNIAKYTHIKDAFFIFDEQRVVGAGVWVKSFLKITQNNLWILLSATPGDTWMDYIPVFIANGLYKNRTEFIRRHVVYNNRVKFPKVDRYVEVARLIRFRDAVVVNMHYVKHTVANDDTVVVGFDQELFNTVLIKRWHVYENRPVRDISELCYLLRRVVNSDPRRADTVGLLMEKHPRVIVFYNFNYERDILLALADRLDVPVAEWNGHKHQSLPTGESWIYIVQYAAGAEGWNCIDTDTIIFYSRNYSYKATVQAAGRIDRRNTPFTDLYYYYLQSNSAIDLAIQKAFNSKRDFNEHRFAAI